MYDQRVGYGGLTMATVFLPLLSLNSFLLPWNVGWPCDLLRPQECYRCDTVELQTKPLRGLGASAFSL